MVPCPINLERSSEMESNNIEVNFEPQSPVEHIDTRSKHKEIEEGAKIKPIVLKLIEARGYQSR